MGKEQNQDSEKTNIEPRPPIVVVMGHIDHGKTTLLDFIRKTDIAAKESGGITQHIGAWRVEVESGPEGERKHITFIDTPGHEAFVAMRSRGAKVADIAILVVAADEGVKPQTKEAIRIIKEAKIPFIVALNKIDRPEANPERVKQELANEDVLVESYGGKIPSVEISAKTGKNISGLLEIILLVTELEHLRADPARLAEGIIIEAHRDPKRGDAASVIVRDGTLRRKDMIVIGNAAEQIKVLEDAQGKVVIEAGPSFPARIPFLSQLPAVGETFQAYPDKRSAEAAIHTPPSPFKTPPSGTAKNQEKHLFNIILKADAAGSLEALAEKIRALARDAIGINIVKKDIGAISESDVKFAAATGKVTIIGFRVRIDGSARELAERAGVRILTGDIIYELLEEVEKILAGAIPLRIRRRDLGRAKILKIFKKEGRRQIAGGRVETGAVEEDAFFEILRPGGSIARGRIYELQQNRARAKDVSAGLEFGMMTDAELPLREGDMVAVFKEEEMRG
jgi:translation initiation factor IF-2